MIRASFSLALSIAVAMATGTQAQDAFNHLDVRAALESRAATPHQGEVVLAKGTPLLIDVVFTNSADHILTVPADLRDWFDLRAAGSCTDVPRTDVITGDGVDELVDFVARNGLPLEFEFVETSDRREVAPHESYRAKLRVSFDAVGPFAVFVSYRPSAAGGRALRLLPRIQQFGYRAPPICGRMESSLTDLERARVLSWEGSQLRLSDPTAAIARFGEAHALAPESVRLELGLAWLLDASGRREEALTHFRQALSRHESGAPDPLGVSSEDDVMIERAARRLEEMSTNSTTHGARR